MDELIGLNRTKQLQKLISSYTGKLIRTHFGKGPESIYVSIGEKYVVIYLRNFISPVEQVLFENGHMDLVYTMREKVMVLIRSELKSYLEKVIGVRPDDFYEDWCLKSKSAVLVALCSQSIPFAPKANEHYEGKAELEQELLLMSRNMHKEPERIYSCEINPRKLLIVRYGVLTSFEREWITAFGDEKLKQMKKKLEKKEIYQSRRLEAILSRPLTDVFIDWNFSADRCLTLLVLKAKSARDIEPIRI